MGGENPFAAETDCDLRRLALACPVGPCLDDLWELRHVGLAQHQADIRMGDEAALGIHHVGPAGLADADLMYHVPDVGQVHLCHADTAVPAGARNGQRHVRLGLAPEIDRAIVDLVGNGQSELVVLRIVGVAADTVHLLARHAQAFAPGLVEKRQLGDRGNLPEQTQAVDLALLDRCTGPGQMRHPPELALDLLDEVADPNGCRARLLLLDAKKKGSMLPIGEPDLDQAVGDERQSDHGGEKHDVFPEQHAEHRAPGGRPGAGNHRSG